MVVGGLLKDFIGVTYMDRDCPWETSQDAILHLTGQSPGAPAQKHLTWGRGTVGETGRGLPGTPITQTNVPIGPWGTGKGSLQVPIPSCGEGPLGTVVLLTHFALHVSRPGLP